MTSVVVSARPRRRNKKVSRASAVQRLRKELQGFSFTPKVDPPKIASAPWMNYTVVIDEAVDILKVTVSKVDDAFQHLSGYRHPEDFHFQYQIRSIRAWNRSFGPIALTPYEHLGDMRECAQITDHASGEHFSRVGYRWSFSGAQRTFFGNDQRLLAKISCVKGTKQNVLVYIETLVRSYGYPNYPPSSVPDGARLETLNDEELEERLDRHNPSPEPPRGKNKKVRFPNIKD